MARKISLRILLKYPVEATMYGLQKGKGPNFEIIQAQLGKGQDLTFDFMVQVKKANASPPTFAGPFVQGPAGKRFVYIVIGNYAGQIAAPWSGRLKIPLSETTFQNLPSDENTFFWYCVVPGRTKDGKPMFATVKPFEGWFTDKNSGQASD